MRGVVEVTKLGALSLKNGSFSGFRREITVVANVFVLRAEGKVSYRLGVGRAIIETYTKNNRSCYLTLHRSSILGDSVERPEHRKVDARFHEVVYVTLLKTEGINHLRPQYHLVDDT
jgi:hypothetical protein